MDAMTSRTRSTRSRFFLLLAVVPLVVSLQARRAGADSWCDQECDHEPGGCNQSDPNCYSRCEQAERDQQRGSSSAAPSATTHDSEPTPPSLPPSSGDDDAGAGAGDNGSADPSFDASID